MPENLKQADRQLDSLAKYLNGTISLENGIYSLNVNDVLGKGQIRSVRFNKFMTSMEIDVKLEKNMLLPLSTDDTDMLYFLYSLEGRCCHKFEDSAEFLDLESLRPFVFMSRKNISSQILIRENERLHLNVIGIDRKGYMKNFKGGARGLDLKLKELLEAFNGHQNRYHLGRHNLKIGKHLKALENNSRNNDLSSLLQFEGISNLILSDQIAQLNQEITNKGQATTLSRKELHTIEELSEFIKNYPEIQHSIKSLCDNGGISSTKLQEGFKLMHELTVSNYIRDIRLEKSEHMIRTSDLNISEVVYSIGLTSRSYFCKIFKAKYKCSPKEYRKKANVITMSL